MDKKDLNNVIPFPGPKTRSEQAPPTSKPKASKKKGVSDNKKVLISSSLLSILFIVTMANRNLMRPQEEAINWTGIEQSEGSRSIASIESSNFARNNDWEKEVAQELSQTVGRKPSSISSSASEEQQFRYGFLGSAYRVQYNLSGKVEEIEYDRSLSARISHDPKYLSASDMLNGRYKSFLPWTFDTWKADKKTVEGEIIEEISLNDKDGNRVGVITFKTDSHGRFLSMKAQSI